jgi:hypothetical protein
MSIFDDKQIDLDLNGPILSFTTNPTGVGSTGVLAGGTGGGSVSLTGIATATFPTSANNAGSIAYQWYEQGIGALSDSTNVTGTATTTLTLSNLITPDDNDRKFFLEADYVPSYYVTGNATNEPLNSGIGTITVDPLITITSQPSNVSVLSGEDAAFIIDAESTGDDDLTFQWQLDGSDVTDGTDTKDGVITTISGATTNTLVLNSDASGITYTVNCVVSSATASNSPITSDEVTYTPQNVATFSIVTIEEISPNTSIASTSEVDLENGEHTFTIAASSSSDDDVVQLYSFFAKEKDLDVEMDLFGGGTNSVGGEGGYSRIRFTMDQNVEYVIAGLIDSVNTPFVYRKSALMVCVGEGGKGGVVGKSGGDGGGVGIAGGNGFGITGSGVGGNLIANGQLTLSGVFGSTVSAPTLYPGDTQAGNNNGGQTIRCTKGVYWAQQGLGACDDIAAETVAATSKFRLSDGTEVTNSAEIVRGYKAGYNIIQTAGKGITAFRGGNGATGGEGGGGNDAGGGGGSGYSDGTVTVVSTRLGGSTESAKVVLRIQS